MIEESHVDRTLNQLLEYFGDRVVVRPPATVACIASLESLFGALPRDLVLFLTTCNGLRVNVQAEGVDEHLLSVSEILGACCDAGGPSAPAGMLPLRGQALELRDWLVLEEGPMHGVVVRWDPWGHGEQLVGSAFGHYLHNWCQYLSETYDAQGRPRGDAPAAFNTEFAVRHDVPLARLMKNPDVEAALNNLELQTACGDDFE